MSDCKKIVITGIPGSGSSKFCERYSSPELTAKSFRGFNMGEMLLTVAQEAQRPPIPAECLLNLQPEYLNALRDRVFDATLAMIGADQEVYDRILIDMHCQFFWNDFFTNAYDWRYLAELEADMFVTLIEKPSTIQDRQRQTAQGRLQNHSLRDLSLWQNVEVNTAQGLASNLHIPHYILPGEQDPLTIESLLKGMFLIYFQMPMTDASSAADAEITAFKSRLLDLGRQIDGLPTPLIDPRTIDIESGADLSPLDSRTVRRHTVSRDLDWYIREASDQVAFYPKGTMLSKGVSDETTRGHETGKNTFVIYSGKNLSPFMDIATRVFASADEFFEFFPDYMAERMQLLRRPIIVD